MAVQVSQRATDGRSGRPSLYVIDFAQPAVAVSAPRPHPLVLQVRRRRMLRRLQQAGSAATWAGAAVLLVLILIGGAAGLR